METRAGVFCVWFLFLASPVAAQEIKVSESLTLPEAQWHVFVPMEIDVSKGHSFEPVAVAPDVWYGIRPETTIGLVHSQVARTGFYGASGDGWCLTGADDGCEDTYTNLGFEARHHVHSGSVSLSAVGGLHFLDFDDATLSMKMGAMGSWWASRTTQVVAHPNLAIGLSDRNQGNEEVLYLPVSVIHMLSPEMQLSWQVGVVLPFEDVSDDYTFPTSVAVQWAPMDKVAFVGAFTFRSLIGGDDVDDGFDERSFTLGTILHL
jgi:hypothetical protein